MRMKLDVIKVFEMAQGMKHRISSRSTCRVNYDIKKNQRKKISNFYII